MIYPYRELPITRKVQECYGREFAAKLGEFDYRVNSLQRPIYTSIHECGGECEELSISSLFASANSTTLKYCMMLNAMNMSLINI